MRTFVDRTGRTWTIDLNVTVAKRIEGLTGVPIISGDMGSVIQTLVGNPITLCDVIYVACKDEADKLGISDEEFGRAMSGDSIDLATDALLQELVDFSPREKKELLEAALRKMRQIEEGVIEKLKGKVSELDVADSVEKIMAGVQTSGGSSTSSQES